MATSIGALMPTLQQTTMTKKPLKNGTMVQINVDPQRIAGDWTPEAIASRKMKGKGVVQGHHDSHGLCYKVAHDDDGTIGAYESHELTAE